MSNNMKGIIYQIGNTDNDFRYVGSTSNDIRIRWNEHKELLNKNNHSNHKLQNDWNNYGEKKFRFEILEVTVVDSKDVLLDLEQQWIRKLDSVKKGYNIRQVTNGCLPAYERDASVLIPFSKADQSCAGEAQMFLLLMGCSRDECKMLRKIIRRDIPANELDDAQYNLMHLLRNEGRKHRNKLAEIITKLESGRVCRVVRK